MVMDFRIVSFIVFFAVIMAASPGLYRKLTNKSRRWDEARCGFLFAATINCGFNLKWLIGGQANETYTLIMLSVAISLGCYYLILLHQWRKED